MPKATNGLVFERRNINILLGVEEIIDDGVCSLRRVFQRPSLARHSKIKAALERAKRERTVLRPVV